MGDNIFFTTKKEGEPEISLISWIQNKEWEKDPKILERVQEVERFLSQIPVEESGNNLKYQFTAWLSLNLNNETLSLIKSKLENRVLVDLGTGEDLINLIKFLNKMGVADFIGNDKFPKKDILSYGTLLENSGIKGAYVNEDMLLFLSKLPDNSTNIMVNGLDRSIISNQEYLKRLKNEISRVLLNNGVVLGFSTNIGEFNGLKNIINDNQPVFILEKNNL